MVEYGRENKMVVEDLAILDSCKSLKISTAEDFERSAVWYATCDRQIKEIDKRWEEKGVIELADKLHKSLCKERNEDKAPWKFAKDIISKERSRYQVVEEAARSEAQRKAEAVEADNKEKERQRLPEQAVKLDGKGKTEQAEAKLEQAENVYSAPVFVPSAVQKKVVLSFGGSVSSKQDFDVVVTDMKAICKAVVDGKLPIGIIEIKSKELKDAVKLNQIKNGDIEGLQIKTKFRDINRK